jgi:hypothetical protein
MPIHNQMLVKELANTNPIFPIGILAIPQKNKINLRFVDRLVKQLNDFLKTNET